MILAGERDGSRRTLCSVVIDLCAAVVAMPTCCPSICHPAAKRPADVPW